MQPKLTSDFITTNPWVLYMMSQGNITQDAMNNNIHSAMRHESTSSTSSFRSNGAGSLHSPTTSQSNTPLVIPHPVKPPPTNNKNRTYQCKMCDQIFSTKSDMLIHSQQVHKQEPKPYRCPQCQKCFANSSYLSQHNRIHAGIKPYKCEICERKFTQLSHLQQHIRTHTGEKPYKCIHGSCGKAFSQLSNLQSHSRSHMTDKPYRCNSCYKCYADEAGLREHIPKHSETKHIKTQICKICGKAYTQETYLARHMTKHSQDGLPKSSIQPIKQEPKEHSIEAVDFTRILDRPNEIQGHSTPAPYPTGKPPLSSAFMPIPQFGTTSSNSSYPYGSGLSSGLSSNNLSSSLPHISSMSTPRYFPYDPIGLRKTAETPDRNVLERNALERNVLERNVLERNVLERNVLERNVLERNAMERNALERNVIERNMNAPITTRTDNLLANSFLSLQHIKNYASQQMPPSFTPCSSATPRLT